MRCCVRSTIGVAVLAAAASLAPSALAQTPANATCATAITLAGPGPSYPWSNVGAGFNGIESFPTCDPRPMFGPQASVWFRWISPFTQSVRLDTIGTPFDTRLVVYANNPCTALGAPVACNDDLSDTVLQSRVTFSAVQGTTYIIRAGSVDPTITGEGLLNFTFTGACCAGVTCSVTTPTACVGANRAFKGLGSVCNAPGSPPFTNNTTPCCRADFTQDGTRNPTDIFSFLTAYFSTDNAERALADTNGNGTREPTDIFEYLTIYFAGGCG
jgi:hypothetical protein